MPKGRGSKLDEQDIHTGKAPHGVETTGHQKKRHSQRKPGQTKPGHPMHKDGWMPNLYGNNPRVTAIKHYLNDTRHSYAPATQEVRTRNLIYLAGVFKELDMPNHPKKFTKNDIQRFMDWMDKRNTGNARKLKLIGYLSGYLAYHENGVIEMMIKNKQLRLPRVVQPIIKSMSAEKVHRIHDSTKNMLGWDGAIARFITLAYPYTGLRPSELRTLKYKDLDQGDWVIRVTHPKGEGLYGQQRIVWILPPAIPAFKEFVKERAVYLMDHNQDANFEALIPYKSRYNMTYWTDGNFRKFKRKIEAISDTRFSLKDYRATYCQMCIDRGVKIGQELTTSVSRTMGHKDTKTTEAFYGRIRNDDANRRLREAFKEPDADSLITA